MLLTGLLDSMPVSRTRHLTRSMHIERSLDETFSFFSAAENLGLITPDFLRFQILTPLPIEMRAGALIEYTISLFGVPMRWLTEITVWEPPFRFIDEQRKGPYKQWIHEHRFEPDGAGTNMFDRVDYEVPGGFAEPIAHALFVGPTVERIFDFREEKLRSIWRNAD